MRIFIGILYVLLAAAPASRAQDARYAGDFAGLGVGARALGLGGAFVALSDDATAVYWNPAALTGRTHREVHTQHAEQFGGAANHDVISLALPVAGGGVGMGIARLGIDDISLTRLEDPTRPLGPDNRPIVSQTAGTTDYAFRLAYARPLRPRWHAGAAFKLVRRNLVADTGTGIGLDAGILFVPTAELRLAAVIYDLTQTRVRYGSGTKDAIDPTIALGLAYSQSVARGRITGVVDLRAGEDTASIDSRRGLRLGIEYQFQRRVAFRMGLHESHLTVGAGLLTERFAIDLAMLEHDQLDNTYRISASLFF